MRITADHREKPSGIIALLIDMGIEVTIRRLPCCDYIINDGIFVERKTRQGFRVSILDGRLFRQASVMKRRVPRPVFLVEGNPFHVDMNFTPESIRGAILSLQVIWYIPVLFSRSREDTCKIFRILGEQQKKQSHLLKLRHSYRPKKMITRQLYILQGFPKIGPMLARRMLQHFGSVRNVMQADVKTLSTIEGIGLGKAKEICRVLDDSVRDQIKCN